MQKHEDNLSIPIPPLGNLKALEGASVTVTDQATGMAAQLWSDNGVTQITAPILSDALGYYSFFAADGRYTLTYTSPEIISFSREIILEDPADGIDALEASGGSDLIGFIQSGTGAKARTLQDRQREAVSVTDFMTKTEREDVLAGTLLLDVTTAVQAALDAHQVVYFPGNCRVTGNLTVTHPYAVLFGDGKYTGSAITRTGSGTGTILTFGAATNYPAIRGMQVRWLPAVGTDYFNTGSVALDITSANTSIDLDDVRLMGCQTLINGNYNSFYNKAHNCRFEQFEFCFYRFSVNNFNVTLSRFKEFKDAFTLNGAGGSANIERNSFEVFNGYLANMTGAEQGVVNFHHNYVEIYDNELLPTNFPVAANALPGRFGGNVLFGGPIGTLSIRDNELGLGGAYIVASLSLCSHFESVGNNLHRYTATDNLRYYVNLPTVQSCVIRDVLGAPVGAAGGYATTYAQSANIPALASPYGQFEFFDAPTNTHLLCPTHKYAPTLLNSWTSPGAPDGIPAVIYDKKGLFLQGEVTGTARTTDVIFTLPAAQRPLEFSANRSYCFLTTASLEGAGGTVQLRYLYATGDFRLENVPASTANIVLDGLFIPARI